MEIFAQGLLLKQANFCPHESKHPHAANDLILVIQNFQQKNKTNFLSNNPKLGFAKNFLNGIASTQGNFDFYALSDQDDIWLEYKLFNSINSIYTKNFDLYCSNLMLWDEDNNNKRILKKDFAQKKYDFLFEGASAGCTYVFTRKFAENLSLNFSKIDLKNWKYFSHDWYLYFFARLNNFKVFIDHNSYILYRIHQSNVHGQLNLNNFNALKKRIQLIKSGWYYNHTYNFKQLLFHHSDLLFIYDMYNKNIFTRIFILLKYNFQLMRSNKKFIKFFILSIFFKSKRF